MSGNDCRVAHPLNTHLAYTAAQWRKVCQPTVDWLAQSFFRAAGLRAAATVEDGVIQVPHMIPPKPLEQGRKLDPLTPPLQTLIGPGLGYRPMPLRGRLRDDPVPLMCWECGKALTGRKRRFCSRDCATAFSSAIPQTIDAGQPEGSKPPTRIDAKGPRRSSASRGTHQSSGSAWKYDAGSGEYYMHLFADKQPDLNWENPNVREDVYDIMRFWLDKGVDGFRMDVIPLISKDQAFSNYPEEHRADPAYFHGSGPRLHEFLQEMNHEVLSRYDVMTVGEALGVTPEQTPLLVDERRGELNMIFNFDAVRIDRGETWRWKPWTLRRDR